MENQIRTLDQFVNQNFSQQGQSQFDLDTQSYNTYLTVYSINCAYRFPDVTDISNIPYDSVKTLARACIGFSKIALETWNEFGTTQQFQMRRNKIPRTG